MIRTVDNQVLEVLDNSKKELKMSNAMNEATLIYLMGCVRDGLYGDCIGSLESIAFKLKDISCESYSYCVSKDVQSACESMMNVIY